MFDPLLKALLTTEDPAEKAALIAESILDKLSPETALTARRCAILHWFDPKIVAALLPKNDPLNAEVVYGQLASLPFIETVSQGLAFHNLTRSGLIDRYATAQPDLLSTAARLAAPLYAVHSDDKHTRAEGFFCYIVAGETEQALNLLDDLLLWADRCEDWQTMLAILALQNEAEKLPFVQPLPRTDLHYLFRGLAHQELDDYPQALADFSSALELNPDFVPAYNNRGITYNELGDYDQALTDFSRALELNPDFATAYYNRGNTYYKLENYQQALSDFSRALELNPTDATAYNNRGNTYDELGNYDQALADFSRALELNPDFAPAYNNRGTTYYKLENYQQALADFSRALELNPDFAPAYNNRGATYYKLENYQQALADFSRALELNPTDATAYYNKACAYALQGRIDQMLPLIGRALELNPKETLARIHNDPDLDPVRDAPRFQALLGEFTDA